MERYNSIVGFNVEHWKPIVGFENYYEVSNYGRVKSMERVVVQKNGKNKRIKQRILKPQKCSNGYLFVGLSVSSRAKLCLIHRLVAISFISSEHIDLEVNHIDEDKENNHVSNLEFVNHKHNINHGTAISRRVSSSNFKGENNPMYGKKGELNKNSRPVCQYDVNGNLLKTYSCAAEAARILNGSKSHIYRCINGHVDYAYGFKWKLYLK